MTLSRDMMVQQTVDDNINMVVPWLLMASYVYYHRPEWNEEVISDLTYDALFIKLKDNWTDIEHRHKYLITEEDINAGSLYGIKEEDFPRMVVGAAEHLIFHR